MSRPLELLFLEFRRHGEPAPLAEVFDRTAPELLRVACHVARDLASAEDLVQSTFLTAIQSADRFDERRALLPWLLGILANHARAARRAGARAAPVPGPREPPLRVLPPLEASPLSGLESRELGDLAQRELDRLPEPYREVAILALRHDLKPQQIAHALGRSPGAVRVQLHRALERLRQKFPRSATLPALLAPELGHGLAAIRVAVLKSAASTAAAAATVLTVGSLVVTKKMLAAVLVVAAATTFVWRTWPAGPNESAPSASHAPTQLAASTDRTASPEEGSSDPTPAPPSRAALPARTDVIAPPPARSEPTRVLEGEVVDGETERPLANATVEFFEPVRMRLSEVKRRYADFDWRWGRDGTVRFNSSWPRLVEPMPEGAWRDAADVELCTDPERGTSPVSRSITSHDGRFELPAATTSGTLVVTHPDYERQVVPIVADAAGETPRSIALFPAREVTGLVVLQGGKPVGQPLRLLLRAHPDSIEHTADGRVVERKADERVRRWMSQLGPWLVDTDAEGRFRFSAGAPHFIASCATVGFEVTLTRYRKTRDDPLGIEVRRKAVLTVIDASTQRPIEDFSLLAISVNHGSPAYAGRFHARDGRLELESGPRTDYGGRAFNPVEESLWFDLWTEGHAPTRVSIPPSDERIDVTVELAPGAPHGLDGRLLRAGAPIADATISLNAFYPLGWSEQSLSKIDETGTAEDGCFVLRGPAGRFVVQMRIDDRPLMRIVDLPASTPFVLDLASGGRIDVVVRDARGTPRPDAKVYIRGPGDRSEFAFTGDSGAAAFETLVAGDYRVSLNGTRETHVPIAQDEKLVQIEESGGVAVALTAPPAGPVHLRVHAEGTRDYSGWRAGDGTYLATDWLDLTADGVLEADAVNMVRMKVAAPGGATWCVPITPGILAEGVLELRVNEIGYRGRVVDRATGAPLANATVRATRQEPWEVVTARADAEGAFVLTNLDDDAFTLSVMRAPPSDRRRRGADDQADPRAWFRPAQPPAPGGREVTLRVPEVTDRTMSGVPRRVFAGRVTRRSDGAPVARATLGLGALYRDDDGEWSVSIEGGIARTSVEGRFEIAAPRAPSYSVWIAQETSGSERRSEQQIWSDGGGSAETEERDVVLD